MGRFINPSPFDKNGLKLIKFNKMMKQVLVFFIGAMFFFSCNEKEVFIENETNSVKSINEIGRYISYSSFDDYFQNDYFQNKDFLLKKSSASSDFISLFSVFKQLEDLQEDSTKQMEFKNLLSQYEEFIVLNDFDDLILLIQDPKLASSLNSKGFIKVGDEYFKFSDKKIYVYSIKDDMLSLQRIEDRDVNISKSDFLKSSSADISVSKSTNWNFEFGPYKLSKHRRVTIYKSVELNSDFGVYVGGRIYYKKKGTWSWKRCNADLKMQYDASSFEYFNSNNIKTVKESISQISTCSNDHQLNAGVTYTNMSSTNKNWTLINPVIRFWRDENGSGTCYIFDQVK